MIEVLSTPRGNVERTEQLDDYARARIPEYWVVDPFRRAVEIYLLAGDDYAPAELSTADVLQPRSFPGLRIRMKEVWTASSSA